MNKEKNFISVVVYTRNDEEYIEKFLKELNNILYEKFLKYEIIFVNDSSTDNTVKKIKEISKTIKSASISVINMSYYQGKELSMNAGVDLSIGDFVYQFETVDIDYDLSLVFDVYKKSLEGYDIVFASNKSKRRITSKIFYKLFNKYANTQNKIDTVTFEIISRRAINRINSMNKTIPYRKAIESNCGLKINSIKYEAISSKKSKLDKPVRKEREANAINSLILFTDVSYKFSIILTFIMFLVAIMMCIYTIIIFVMKKPIEGWTTTMLFLSFGFSGMFLLYAIVIKYLSLIINLIFKKSNYLIDSIDKLN